MIADPKIFYKTYLAEYHWYKVQTLKLALENQQEFFKNSLHDTPNEEELERYSRIVKLDIRHNYFHCMETMFTLLIGLDPFKFSFYDEDLLFRITKIDIDYIYSRVQTFAKDEKGLNFIKKKMRFGNSKIYPHVGKYLFYKGIGEFNPKTTIPDSQFDESIEAIIHGLKLLAIDFSDRDEYNSFKHGLRLVPNINKLILADPKTLESKLEFDLTDSISYYRRQKSIDKTESIESVTRVFDTERDCQMTSFCSNLITSMIEPRRMMYYRDSKRTDNSVPVVIFGKESISKCATSSPNFSVWKHKMTKTT
jgi:hypothetical protein